MYLLRRTSPRVTSAARPRRPWHTSPSPSLPLRVSTLAPAPSYVRWRLLLRPCVPGLRCASPKRCTSCRSVLYCSADCQAGGPTHCSHFSLASSAGSQQRSCDDLSDTPRLPPPPVPRSEPGAAATGRSAARSPACSRRATKRRRRPTGFYSGCCTGAPLARRSRCPNPNNPPETGVFRI